MRAERRKATQGAGMKSLIGEAGAVKVRAN
jgi:hypothetical protein